MKRIFFSLLIGLFTAPPVFAQGCDPNQPWNDVSVQCFGQEQDAARPSGGGEINQGAYIKTTTEKMALAQVCGLTGVACTAIPEQIPFFIQKSTLGSLSRYVAMMYENPPADFGLWLADTGRTLGFLPAAVFAQGTGFSGLAPLLPLWKAFRNVSYLLLAVFMVVIGFMVMFRKKIDPKTVVTVQNALPRIVVTLLLITFSYAIVGFLIDLMYVVLLLVISIVVSASNGALGPDTATKYLSQGFWTAAGGLFWGGMKSLDDIAAFLPFNLGKIGAYGGGIIGPILAIGALMNAAFIGPLAVVLMGLPAIFILIIALLLVFAVIRIFFMMLSAYINIIIALLVAPFQLLLEAIPGTSTFSSWITNLVANLAVFPATAGLLLIGTILTSFEVNPLGVQAGVSQATPLWTPPLLSSSQTHGLAGLIGLGMLLGIPSFVGLIKEALKAKPAVSVFGGGGQTLQTGMQLISTAFYASQLLPKNIRDRIFGSGQGSQSEG